MSATPERRFALTPPSPYGDKWRARLNRLPEETPASALGIAPGDSVVVLGAHPDDETFGLGATIAELASRGVDVHLVSLSAAGAALDLVGVKVPGLADRRRTEFVRAGEALGAASAKVLDFPGRRLAEFEHSVAAALTMILRRRRACHLLTVWWHDPQPEHRAAGRAALRAGEITGCRVSGYPIWAQHWSDPELTLTRAQNVTIMSTTPRSRSARDAAIACYSSEPEPMTGDHDLTVPDALVTWSHELVIR